MSYEQRVEEMKKKMRLIVALGELAAGKPADVRDLAILAKAILLLMEDKSRDKEVWPTSTCDTTKPHSSQRI